MKKNNLPISGNRTKKGIIYTREITQIPQSLPQPNLIIIHDNPKSANRKKQDMPSNQILANANNNNANNIANAYSNPQLKQFNQPTNSTTNQNCLPKKASIQKRNRQYRDKELTDNPNHHGRTNELFTKSEENASTYKSKPDYCGSNYATDANINNNDNKRTNELNKDNKSLLIQTINILQLYIKKIKEIYETKLYSTIKSKNEEMAHLKVIIYLFLSLCIRMKRNA